MDRLEDFPNHRVWVPFCLTILCLSHFFLLSFWYKQSGRTIANDFISIIISNNGAKIPDEVQQKIFSDGFTTKSTGNGIGLYVCRQTLEEQFARLELLKSDENSTDFEILISMV